MPSPRRHYHDVRSLAIWTVRGELRRLPVCPRLRAQLISMREATSRLTGVAMEYELMLRIVLEKPLLAWTSVCRKAGAASTKSSNGRNPRRRTFSSISRCTQELVAKVGRQTSLVHSCKVRPQNDLFMST